VLGLREIRRRPDEKGRYTNAFLMPTIDEIRVLQLEIARQARGSGQRWKGMHESGRGLRRT
jgi:hypothetical protein